MCQLAKNHCAIHLTNLNSKQSRSAFWSIKMPYDDGMVSINQNIHMHTWSLAPRE